MTSNDFQKFKDVLAGVHDFYGKNLSQFGLDVWWKALKIHDFEAVSEAFSRHLMNTDEGQFMPKPAHILKMMEGTSQDSAMVAWSKVDSALRSVGTYQSVVFDDPLIHKVLQDMGGWIPLGTKTDDEWPFVAREFQTRYRGFKSRNQIPEYPSHLIGIAECHNSKEGFRIDPPSLIGNVEKAKQIMNKGIGLVEFENGVGLQRLQKDLTKAVGNMSAISSKDAA